MSTLPNPDPPRNRRRLPAEPLEMLLLRPDDLSGILAAAAAHDMPAHKVLADAANLSEMAARFLLACGAKVAEAAASEGVACVACNGAIRDPAGVACGALIPTRAPKHAEGFALCARCVAIGGNIHGRAAAGIQRRWPEARVVKMQPGGRA